MGTTHTQGKAVKGAGGDGWDDECRKALQACGIDPTAYGSYNDRKNAQGKLRKAYRERRDREAAAARGNKKAIAECKAKGWTPRAHEPSCPQSAAKKGKKPLCMCHESSAALDDMQPELWLRANSQSAHVLGNAFMQGRRGDPCSNVPPGRDREGRPHGGTYGYDDTQALCTDMLGDSRKVGTEHYSGTRVEDALGESFRTRAEIRRRNGEPEATANALDTNDLKMVVSDTQEVTGRGPPSNHLKDDDEALETKKLHREARAARAEELSQPTAASGQGQQSSASGASAKKNKKPKKPGPSADDVAKMQKCIEDRWEQSLDTMRAQSVAEYGPPNASGALDAHNAGPPPVKPPKTWDQLSPAEQRAAVVKRMEQLEKRGAHDAMVSKESREKDIAEKRKKGEPVTAADKAEAKRAPTEDECREYQALWLHQNGGNRTPPAFPPMQGKPPATMPDPPPALSGGVKSPGKKK